MTKAGHRQSRHIYREEREREGERLRQNTTNLYKQGNGGSAKQPDARMFDADVHVCVCETVGSVMINVFFYAVFQTILLEDTHTDQFVSTHPFTTKHIVRLEKIFSIII